MCSYTYTTPDAISNETNLNLLTAIAWGIILVPSFLMFEHFKNLKSVKTPEMLIPPVMMVAHFFIKFLTRLQVIFLSELACCLNLGDIRFPVFLRL